jgi:hypothetical protein
MKNRPAVFFVLPALVLAGFFTPMAGAAVQDDGARMGALLEVSEINVTGVSPENITGLSGYEPTPAPIEARVGVEESQLPGPKGEMAAGPRYIGVSVSPAVLAIVAAIACAAVLAAVYFSRRKRGGEEEEE